MRCGLLPSYLPSPLSVKPANLVEKAAGEEIFGCLLTPQRYDVYLHGAASDFRFLLLGSENYL